jgi:hypothetical protein
MRHVAAVLLAAVLLAVPASGSAVVTVSFDPPSSLVGEGTYFVVRVHVDSEAQDLRGFSFDSSVIDPVSVTGGPLLLGAGCPNFFDDLTTGAAADSVWFDGASLGCSMVGPGLVAEIQFLAVAEGVSDLSWWRCILRDGDNANIPHTCVGGNVVVVGSISVEPRTWGSVKASYREREAGPRP